MKISQQGINLIKEFEGCRLTTYADTGGVATIGYGHTGSDVRSGQCISETEAENLLRKDVERFEKAVSSEVKVSLSQNQFDALVSFAFNVGQGNLHTSTLLKKLNQSDYQGAAQEFPRWCKDNRGHELLGLKRRREAEKKLFLQTKPDSNKVQTGICTIKAVKETCLKKVVAQSSQLLDDQKVAVHVGKTYKILNHTPAEQGHYKVELDYGAGTWYIWSGHWQLPWEDHTEEHEPVEQQFINSIEQSSDGSVPQNWQSINWNDFQAKVSKYFSVGEVAHQDRRRIPTDNTIKQNVFTLAQELDKVREAWGSPIIVTSWYRPPAINRAVGGASNSQHLYGKAADIRPVQGDVYQFQDWLDKTAWQNKALGYGAKKGFVHLDLRPGHIRWIY
ncbi:MAG: D-Ala-D-Ala carboxypeptidase family metallohydrolase [Crocosphaera sp.]|nr:D-Ala-D-Ala carboxypeptidase family metallohydrolase [Crocosphaera sp.]